MCVNATVCHWCVFNRFWTTVELYDTEESMDLFSMSKMYNTIRLNLLNFKAKDLITWEAQTEAQLEERQTAQHTIIPPSAPHQPQHCNTHTQKCKLSWGSHWRLHAHTDLARPCHKALDNHTHTHTYMDIISCWPSHSLYREEDAVMLKHQNMNDALLQPVGF